MVGLPGDGGDYLREGSSQEIFLTRVLSHRNILFADCNRPKLTFSGD